MYRISEGDPLDLADVGKFIDLINEPPAGLDTFFDESKDIFVTRAPGRLDVMGGIADYSGSLVLEMPIAEATFAAIQKSGDRMVKIVSSHVSSSKHSTFEMKLGDLQRKGKPRDYAEVRDFFERIRHFHWASYAVGVFFVLKQELGVDFQTGARILISSRVPVGKGVSSSAALEVAVMQAVCTAYDIAIEPRELAMLCQKVENSIVGAACGVMDQITAHCGVENSLVSLLCQPAEIDNAVKIPDGLELWGIDSGVRHAVAGSDYTSVRVGAFMGYRVIAEYAGLDIEQVAYGLVEIDDGRWRGYLANVSPAEYENEFASKVPVSISGEEFLASYGGTTDTVTKIDPAKIYAVKAPAEHAIYESARVQRFAKLLKNAADETNVDQLGELMFESHNSYAACGLTEPRTDRIVELVREYRGEGLFGARITGGGSGGTLAILARRGSCEVIMQLAERFGKEARQKPYVFHGSSPGCATFGHLRISNAEARA
jgi:galactokinase